MAKARTAEKLQQQLTGAEAANRKHKDRIAELERMTEHQARALEAQAEHIAKTEQELSEALGRLKTA
jgi:chromosome segregation ATPase